MWQFVYEKIYPNVTKEQVWSVYADVNAWPTWDSELEWCQFSGEFISGNSFILKPKGAPKVTILLDEVIPYRRFLDHCRFFGAVLSDDHYLEETDDGLKLTNIISLKGILSWFWVFCVAKNMAKSIPHQLDCLVKLARTR